MKSDIVKFIQDELFYLTSKKYSKKYIEKKIIPIYEFINNSNKSKFLISGAQGIGKSTILKLLKKIFDNFSKKKLLCFSLDDYYFSKKYRKKLSNQIHPLLATRGVPGTHDIKKLLNNIRKFENKKYPIKLPIFDKLIDNISKKSLIVNSKADVLILEGWCCGSPYLERNYLKKDINKVEKTLDKNMDWRNYYNHRLKTDYSKLFKKFDYSIYFKAPSFKQILNWRSKQELFLAKKHSSKKNIMNKDNIRDFIQYYEKITKWMIKKMPIKSKLVLFINEKQQIDKLKFN